MDIEKHGQLLNGLGQYYGSAVMSQKNRPKKMDYFDFVVSEVHGLRIKELNDLRAQGKKVIGAFCIYAPEELAYAADATMVGLCGGADFSVPDAEAVLPRNLCPLIKSFYGFKLNRTCPYFQSSDLVVGETTCDGKKKVYELLSELIPTYVLEVPHKPDTQQGKEFWYKELEAFSYSVSHDLRAPLRHVLGYVEMLAQEAGDQLSEEGRRYLKTITDASKEMGELIDDLLAFSRMGRVEMRETSVELDALVQKTLRDLQSTTSGRNIVWKIPPLPVVQGDPAMLKQVLANLLGNAVKYTRPRDSAQIEFGCAGKEDGRIILFVRDNGVGFDPQYAHKLFGVFQRLHRADQFEGTGIGLANVRRIIARHGGRTWAEGEVNEGATFYFTLKPASDPVK